MDRSEHVGMLVVVSTQNGVRGKGGLLEDVVFLTLHQAWGEEMPLNQYQKVIASSSYELRL